MDATRRPRIAEPPEAPAAPGLLRGIRRWDLVALVLNSIIGAGIFGLPARAFASAGAWSLVAYAACAVVVLLIIICFAEVSSRFKDTGGPYLYAHETFGPLVGFEMGFMLWIARLTAFSALCNLWLDYLAHFAIGANTGSTRSLLIVGIVAFFTLLNIRGVRRSSNFNAVFTIAKLVPLLLFVIVGLFFVRPENFDFSAGVEFPVFSSTVLMLVFAFSGFEMTVIPAGESRDPRRHSPFALFTGLALVVVLYLLIQTVSIGTYPELAQSERSLADAANAFAGVTGAAIIAVGALISVTGTLNVIVLVGPRLLYAMAERRQLPAAFGRTHPVYRTPWVAITVSSAVMLVLTLQGSFVSSLTVSTIIRLATYASTCLALPVLRMRPDAPPAEFMPRGGVAAAVAAVGLCIWLIATSSRGDLLTMLYVIIAGLLLYLPMRAAAARSPFVPPADPA